MSGARASSLILVAGNFVLDDPQKTVLQIAALPHRLVVRTSGATFVLVPTSASEFVSLDDVPGTFTFVDGKLIFRQPENSVQTGTRQAI